MDKNYCFILAGMEDRIDALNRCVNCIKATQYKNADVYLYWQGTSVGSIEDKGFFKEIVWDVKPRGVFTPRYELMKQFCLGYDYTIIIDDDLFMYPDTTYDNAINFLDSKEDAGCVCIGGHFDKRRGEFVCVSDKMGYYNVRGGLVLPRRSVKIILDYFKDKEEDYTEDMFWLLLYVKGYDLWQDYSSNSIHISNYKSKKKHTGYSKIRLEQPYKPILSEFFHDAKLTTEDGRWDKPVRDIKSLKYINENGIAERKKNRGETKN